MKSIGSILLVLVSLGAFFYATKELLSGDAPTVSLRGRRLLQDPRTVISKPDYAQLQNAAAGTMGTLSQQSSQNFGQQVQHAESETAAVDNILQTVAHAGMNMAKGNLLSNDVTGTVSSMQQQDQTGGMQQQQLVDPSALQQQQTGGMQQLGGSSALMQQQDVLGSMSGGMTGSSSGVNGLESSMLSPQQHDTSSNMLSQQGLSTMDQQQLGGQMMQQGSTASLEQQQQQQGGESSTTTQQQQQDPYGSTAGAQDGQLQTKGSADRKLEFIHITKSGGSAVEKIAAEKNIMWGACHYWKIPYLGCETPDWDFPKKRRVDRMPNGLTYQGEPWHAPPHWNDPNMMEGSDTFLIVRNPYDRIISEYYCSAFGYKGDNREDPVVFNEWLAGNLTLLSEKLQGHMLPQNYYVYDENGIKVVSHILRYENLQPEFDALMEQYNLPLRMPEKSAKTVFHFKKKGSKKDGDANKITINDISPENIQMMNEVYARDFEFFGYPPITTTPSMSEGQGGTLNPDSSASEIGSSLLQGNLMGGSSGMASSGGDQQQKLSSQGGAMMSNDPQQQQQQMLGQGRASGVLSNDPQQQQQQMLGQEGSTSGGMNDLSNDPQQQQQQMLGQDGSTSGGMSDSQMLGQTGGGSLMSNDPQQQQQQQQQLLSQDGTTAGMGDSQALGGGSANGMISNQQPLMDGQQQQMVGQGGSSSGGMAPQQQQLDGQQQQMMGQGGSSSGGRAPQQQQQGGSSLLDPRQVAMPDSGGGGGSLSNNSMLNQQMAGGSSSGSQMMQGGNTMMQGGNSLGSSSGGSSLSQQGNMRMSGGN
eukprot:CAMPEP_0119005186 /NCGR_PEP_ID=MMETSP1176-20130426/1571_1 /TAXON_ID=265551 /ORGANISM="Synedropsis recta cf, Strain CCMP1620" /LENGTH=811 /DNA_ID=CAMNT_0006956963 /DNA_START=82 /DNA_END=2517 /DNA_ORIENTATION=+